MDLIKHRKKYFVISSLIILAGLISVIVNGLNYGIDFTGGSLIQIDLEEKREIDEVREVMDEFDKNAEIIFSGENKEGIIIKTGEGFLRLSVIQLAGKKRMKVSDFLRGNELPVGTILGN